MFSWGMFPHIPFPSLSYFAATIFGDTYGSAGWSEANIQGEHVKALDELFIFVFEHN
jgi:hypothetical protein